MTTGRRRMAPAGLALCILLFAGAAMAGDGMAVTKDGDTITIAGETNLAAGNVLQVTVISADFTPTTKDEAGAFSGAAGTVVVTEGMPLNRFSFGMDVSGFVPGRYLVTVESVETGLRETAQFVLPWPATPIPHTPPEAMQSAAIPPPSPVSPFVPPGTGVSPVPVPLLMVTALAALSLALAIRQ